MLKNIAIPVQSFFLLAFKKKNATKQKWIKSLLLTEKFTDIIFMLAAS